MKYYELISGATFVGIGTDLDLCCYQSKHNVVLKCDITRAQFIMYKDKLYHATWMVSTRNVNVDYEVVDIMEISKEDYDELASKVEQGEEIDTGFEDEPYVEEPVVEPPTNQQIATLEYLKSAKITEMNAKCNQAIIHGFDVVLSDGEAHHFSLTTQDQLNMITLSTQIAAGETQIPYHADNEMCKFFGVEDIMTIIATATQHKTYHVTYFNSLKAYINSLDNVDDVANIDYGVVIPEEYCSVVLAELVQSTVVNNE